MRDMPERHPVGMRDMPERHPVGMGDMQEEHPVGMGDMQERHLLGMVGEGGIPRTYRPCTLGGHTTRAYTA